MEVFVAELCDLIQASDSFFVFRKADRLGVHLVEVRVVFAEESA